MDSRSTDPADYPHLPRAVVAMAMLLTRLYSPLMLRNVVYPMCNVGTFAAWPLFFAGFIFGLPILLKLRMLNFLMVC